ERLRGGERAHPGGPGAVGRPPQGRGSHQDPGERGAEGGPHRARAPVHRLRGQEDRGSGRQGGGHRRGGRMIQTMKNIWSIPDLRKRILYTFGLLLVYRIGGHIPTPGIDNRALLDLFERQAGSILGVVDLFSGGNFKRFTIFALGIMPYITASIVLQLLTVMWPYLEKLSKEGEAGRKKITQYTRYGTVLLSFIQALGVAFWLESASS